ncbi:hypothetical protein [Streptomyces sp. NPDC007369]|uniref:hypothetical protein n=1 Tax=Streptomyces sp. NPDC007369 TaxID=3154589 RepID=UPI0033EAF2D4
MADDGDKLRRAIELLLLPGVTKVPITELLPMLTEKKSNRDLARKAREGMNQITGEGLTDEQRTELVALTAVVRQYA